MTPNSPSLDSRPLFQAPGAAGWYQIAIQIPTPLGNEDYPVLATVGSVSSVMGRLITVRN